MIYHIDDIPEHLREFFGPAPQIGDEESPSAFVDALVAVFREVRRVLRDDGTCWVNLGDSYCNTDKWGGGGPNTGKQTVTADGDVPPWAVRARKAPIAGVKPKDLVGIPWAVAFALRDDGWWLRSDIIWHKPNPMPESVTDRPTKAHEYLFLLTKSPTYFYDADAIAEPCTWGNGQRVVNVDTPKNRKAGLRPTRAYGHELEGGRNARTVWTFPTGNFGEAHFATFPELLAQRCILAGSSEKGACAACGAPWARSVESESASANNERDWQGVPEHQANRGMAQMPKKKGAVGTPSRSTTGWAPTCECPDTARVRPCVVLDPFAGSGTTLAVADAHQRAFVGIELNPEYAEMARRRVFRDGAPLFSGTL